MARASSKKSQTPAKKASRATQAPDATRYPASGFGVAAFLSLLLALGLLMALLSFSPEAPKNWMGPVGRRVAKELLDGLGLGSYLLAALLLLGSLGRLLGRFRRPSVAVLGFSAISLLAALMLLAFFDGQIQGAPAGGMVGMVTAGLLRKVVGAGGTLLLAFGLLGIGLMGLTGVPPRRFFGMLQERVNRFWLWAKHSIETRREARRVLKAREAELVQEAAIRQNEAEQARMDREAALIAKLEEKKRRAVLKASVQAEERALKRIAKAEAERRIEGMAPAADVVEALDGAQALDARAELEREAEAAKPSAPAGPPGRSSLRPPLEERDGPELEDAAEVVERLDRLDEPVTRVEGAARRRGTARPPLQDAEANAEPKAAAEAAAEVDSRAEIDPKVSPEPPEAVKEPEVAKEPEVVIHARKEAQADFSEPVEPARTPVEPKAAAATYELPPVSLLDYDADAPDAIDPGELKARATRLEEKLRTYNVDGKVVAIRPGPVVTTYEYQPAPGVKVAKIAALTDDIAMSMEAERVRIVAPIPGRGVVGIELPNNRRENVYLKEIIAHETFKNSKSLLTLGLGKDAEGEPRSQDLRKMPHLMIAGTTGSGKSVSINTMILSMLYKATPDQVKFIMVDPKMLELSLYADIPHLLLPVVTDPKKASLALSWAVDEMERRYQLLSDMKVRGIDGYNRRLERLRKQRDADAKIAVERALRAAEARRAQTEEAENLSESDLLELEGLPEEQQDLAEALVEAPEDRVADPWPEEELPDAMPYIVVLIDEFADLMMAASKDVEASVQRLAQKARAAGIHVLLATQRPSTDVITGVIKNNFPARIAFKVASRHDSATILNTPGAENLLGMGDSLFLSVASPSPVRIHGAFVSEDEVERVVEFWKAQAKPRYDLSILEPPADEAADLADEDMDPLYDQAVAIVTETQNASISAVQRKLKIGYNRAARMIEMMEAQGIVSAPSGAKREREVLVKGFGDTL